MQNVIFHIELVPVVTCMTAAAAVWFSGSCDLAVGRGQRLDHCGPLLSRPASTTTTYWSSYPSTENRKLE